MSVGKMAFNNMAKTVPMEYGVVNKMRMPSLIPRSPLLQSPPSRNGPVHGQNGAVHNYGGTLVAKNVIWRNNYGYLCLSKHRALAAGILIAHSSPRD